MDAELTFTAVEEPIPSAARLHALMPALHAWYLRDGDAARPSYVVARRALATHMPELLTTWQELSERASGGDLAARILTLYDPPPLLAGCSQAVINGELVRNYDYFPDRIEAAVFKSAITRPVLGMSDCLWGLLDGVNDAGLSAALAFGGRQARGEGFGITIVVRYLLETCDTVAQATATLARLPVHAPYNLTLVDAQGDASTVFVGPDRAARAVRPALATNHQEHVDWPEHARATRSLERYEALAAGADFLAPPLYAGAYREGFGTLYTAAYSPSARAATYRWPGEPAWEQSLGVFTPSTRTVRLRQRADGHVGAGPR
jgi:predicted choloylglycine hydrolase